MKNKDRYNLNHLEWEIETWKGLVDGNQTKKVTLIHENMPIITFHTHKMPFKAILEWLEQDLEDY